MKTIYLLLLLGALQFSLVAADEKKADEKALPEGAVLIVIKPQKSEVAKGEEIDIEVFIRNATWETIKIPPSVNHDGYSSTIVVFDVRTFNIKGDQLESVSESRASSGITCLSDRSLEAQKTQRYKFRWKCPDEDFDVLSLRAEFFIEGAFRSGQTAITLKSAMAEMATPRKPSD